MKKKLFTLIMACVFVIACAFGFAACSDKQPAKADQLYATDGVNNDYNGLTSYNITIEYGQNLDLSKYKLFLSYSDGSKKEVARNDEKLAVKYYYLQHNSENRQEVSELPDDKICGNYTIEYIYDGNAELKAEVIINVFKTSNGSFTVQPVGGTTWQSQGEVHKVIVKNPKGAEVKMEYVHETLGDGAVSSTPKPIEKTNDTDGHYDLLLFKKSVYDGFTAEQKNDYDFLYEYINAYIYNPEFDEVVGADEGEYMLIALIDKTYNYSKIATPAVQITVTKPSWQI